MKNPEIYFRYISADQLKLDELQPDDVSRPEMVYRVCRYRPYMAAIENGMVAPVSTVFRRAYELTDAYMEHKGQEKVWICEYRERP